MYVYLTIKVEYVLGTFYLYTNPIYKPTQTHTIKPQEMLRGYKNEVDYKRECSIALVFFFEKKSVSSSCIFRTKISF